MAEKKFFVDINLQGSALTNATIGTNSSLTKAGSFGFDGTRLQYFNGTAIEEVANLADIAAVTGGLIFQGGYDPTTDTPDITDGSALKGFFWAATAAGTFLGESVQVGDSIVAKVDAAGATAADWLILQGNIVIATDSVDGISRLATQTEANDGTEGGAVVITPATLQGKIDAQITPEINSKLPLAGGTMSGDINLDGNDINNVEAIRAHGVITNGLEAKDGTTILVYSDVDFMESTVLGVGTPTNGTDAANKLYVDGQVATALPLAGGTMSGTIYMDNAGSVENAINLSGQTLLVNEIQGLNDAEIIVDAIFNMSGRSITDLAAPTNEGDAANKSYVDTAASTAQANAEATASADATAKADAAQAAAEAYADSLAPNYDAAGSAAQALTDANAYTDTEIAAISGKITIDAANWLFTAGEYYQSIDVSAYGINPIIQVLNIDYQIAEFGVFMSGQDGTITLKSNIPVTSNCYLLASKVF